MVVGRLGSLDENERDTMKKRQVLICSDWFIPAYRAGGPIRSVYHIAELLSSYLDVWVLTGSVDLGGEQLNVPLDTWVRRKNGFHVQYVSSHRSMPQALNTAMREIDPDTVHLNSVFSWRFTLLPLLLNRLLFKRKTILAPRGMLGKGALQEKRAKKHMFFLAARAIGMYQGVCWHASTPLEAKEVMEVFPRAKIHVAKNIPLQSEHRHAARTFESIKLLYVGRISRKKNLSFVIDVLAAMNFNMKVQLRIVGPIEDRDYAETIMNAIPEESKLDVTMEGSLNHEDVAKAFRASHFMVLPTLHENYGHAIVESWAHGCPVVLSTNTPWRDLNSKGIGWDLPLEKTAWKGVFQEIEAMNEADWNRLSGQCRLYFQSSVYNAEDERANLALFDL